MFANIPPRDIHHLGRECGGCHHNQRLPELQTIIIKYLLELQLEAHLHHAVGLVQHQLLALRQVQLAALEQVQQAARTRDHEVHLLRAQRLHLLLQVHAAEQRHLSYIVVEDHFDEFAFNLHGEFSRRGDHQALGRRKALFVVVHIGVLVVPVLKLVVQNRDDEAECLARACLCVQHYIVA